MECGEYGAILQLPLGRDTIHDDGSLWHTMILPFIEQKALYDTLYFIEGGNGNWDSGSARASRQLRA